MSRIKRLLFRVSVVDVFDVDLIVILMISRMPSSALIYCVLVRALTFVILLQTKQTTTGDHLEEVAEMIVSKFGVNGDAVFLDLDGEFVPFGG